MAASTVHMKEGPDSGKAGYGSQGLSLWSQTPTVQSCTFAFYLLNGFCVCVFMEYRKRD